jgi:hypothetical protein
MTSPQDLQRGTCASAIDCGEPCCIHVGRCYKSLERETLTLQEQLTDERERNRELLEVMVAAAEEIAAHWEAHCDKDGYGPANLERRLREGIATSYPGYSLGEFQKLREKSERLERTLAMIDAIEQRDALIRELVKWLEILNSPSPMGDDHRQAYSAEALAAARKAVK